MKSSLRRRLQEWKKDSVYVKKLFLVSMARFVVGEGTATRVKALVAISIALLKFL